LNLRVSTNSHFLELPFTIEIYFDLNRKSKSELIWTIASSGLFVITLLTVSLICIYRRRRDLRNAKLQQRVYNSLPEDYNPIIDVDCYKGLNASESLILVTSDSIIPTEPMNVPVLAGNNHSLIVFEKTSSSFKEDLCSSCNAQLYKKEQRKKLKCGHSLHTACAQMLWRFNPSLPQQMCPVCGIKVEVVYE